VSRDPPQLVEADRAHLKSQARLSFLIWRALARSDLQCGLHYAVTVDLYRTSCDTVCGCSRPGTIVIAEIAASFLRPRLAIFVEVATVQPTQHRRANPVAQLDAVHSVLRLNYETLKGLISLALTSVAKPTRFETPDNLRFIP
jgi:hypothetical protein